MYMFVKFRNKIFKIKKINVYCVFCNLGLEMKILNVLFFGGQLCTLSGCLDARAVFRFVAESKHRNSHYFYLYSHKLYI